jgi:para-aminobenzoate synthetase component 1
VIRKFISFPIADLQHTKQQMLNWANRFNICCFLDNHQYTFSHTTVECILAAGAASSVSARAGNALDSFQDFYDQADDWIFGHLGYDLKNEIEVLRSDNPDGLLFPDLFFFVPEILVQLGPSAITIGVHGDGHEAIYREIMATEKVQQEQDAVTISHRYTKSEYVAIVEKLKQHILKGDCYEINFCQEFFAKNVRISPLELYISLSIASPNPFSAYYKLQDKYLLCLSPERYLKKEGRHIISQPIKGTSKRDKEHDREGISKLQNDSKERAENIMIVDLVRNDLSRICRKGSVQVDDLCAVYTFPQVYQMVSTISGELDEGVTASDAVRATFPMGSMTGAPKKKVMELIEHYEGSRRGLFSGSVGYFTPDGDFDLNVVIRSVLYNESEKYLSFHTGSAITFKSDPESEYEECLLKADAIKNALG